MKKYAVIMHTDEGDFPYGRYKEKEKAVKTALEVQKERSWYTYIVEIWED